MVPGMHQLNGLVRSRRRKNGGPASEPAYPVGEPVRVVLGSGHRASPDYEVVGREGLSQLGFPAIGSEVDDLGGGVVDHLERGILVDVSHVQMTVGRDHRDAGVKADPAGEHAGRLSHHPRQ